MGHYCPRRKQALLYATGAGIFCLVTLTLFYIIPPHNRSNNAGRKYRHAKNAGGYQQISGSNVIDLVNLEKLERLEHFQLCPRWFKLAGQLKKCFLARFGRLSNEHFWSHLSPISAECGSDLVRGLLSTKYLVNKDDVKLVIPPGNLEPSVSVTIGIGNDTFAENRLLKLVPHLKFYGADPILSSGALFEKLGRYEQIAVAAKPGMINASVLINGRYRWVDLEAITLGDLLKQRFNQTVVDYLFLDVEGTEYGILPQLAHELQVRQLTICQINVELHGPLDKYGIDSKQFAQVMRRLLHSTSPYVPLWIPQPTFHHRLFLIDWKSPYCSKKFYASWC